MTCTTDNYVRLTGWVLHLLATEEAYLQCQIAKKAELCDL